LSPLFGIGGLVEKRYNIISAAIEDRPRVLEQPLFLQGIQIFPLQVLHQRNLKGFLISKIPADDGNFFQINSLAALSRRPQPLIHSHQYPRDEPGVAPECHALV
jgi:hypothetical protein